jgi:Holliday junction resolvase-like predicted endonuclease
MIEFPEETNGTNSESVTNQLIEAIKKLSESQQDYLLQAVKDWINDHREYPRKECQADVLYSDNKRLTQGIIVNISASGLYLQPDSPFKVGEIITLTFEHPFAKKQVKVEGEIVRRDEKGIGVKFSQSIGSLL